MSRVLIVEDEEAIADNRRIRKTSTLSIFKKASQRSRLLRDLKLFEK